MRRTLAAVRPTEFRRHHRAGLALPAGPDGQHSAVRRPQERPRPDRLSASDARRGAEGNLRHLRLPGTGDAGGAGARRLLAWARPICSAARWARRSSRRWTPSAPASSRARRQRHRPGQGQRAVRLDRQVRRLRLQQEPRRGLRAGRLPHRLAEGASPGRILRRVDELRHGADRQARPVRRGHPPQRGRVPAARRQCQPRRFLGRGRQGPLCARRAEGRRRKGDGGAGRRARRATVRSSSLDDFAERIDPRLLNRRQIESLAAAGAFDSLKPDRAAVFAAAETILAHAASARTTSGPAASTACSAAARAAGVAPIRLPRDARWTLAERMAAERDAFGFYFSAHPVDSQRHLLAAHKVRSLRRAGAMPRARRRRALDRR